MMKFEDDRIDDDDDVDVVFDDDMGGIVKDYCDGTSSSDEEEHCLENFRDGKESARYLNVGGPNIIGRGGKRVGTTTTTTTGRAPQSPRPSTSLPGSTDARAIGEDIDGQGDDDEYDDDDYDEYEYDDVDEDDEYDKLSREGATSTRATVAGTRVGRSGSDVDTMGDYTRRGTGSGNDGMDGGIIRPHSPPTVTSPILPPSSSHSSSLSYSSSLSGTAGEGNDKKDDGDDPPYRKEMTALSRTRRKSAPDDDFGGSSMSFRDGKTRMAVYKDGAFKVQPVEDFPVVAAVEEEEDEREEQVQRVGIDDAVRQAFAARLMPSLSSPSSSTTSSKKLLSIDPKSIEIVPLSKGKAEEIRESGGRTTEVDRDGVDNHSISEYTDKGELSFSTPPDAADALSLDSGVFVKMFRGSASYIANHRGTIAVYHIPGELLAWDGFPGLMDDIALTWLLGMKIVLVAGCRHQIDLRLENKHEDEEDDDEDEEGENRHTSHGNGDGTGNEEESTEQQLEHSFGGKVMMSSIRVTDEETLRVVKEEAGFVRFEIERRLAKSLRLHGGLVKGSESLVGNVVSGNFYSAQVNNPIIFPFVSCRLFLQLMMLDAHTLTISLAAFWRCRWSRLLLDR
jgi:hypothetical protein